MEEKQGGFVSMYPYKVMFDMSFYDICLVIAVLLALFLADRMATRSGFSVKLQKVFIFSIIGAIVAGFVGAILFQAVYDWIKNGEFVLSVTTGLTFYGGLIFGVIGFLAVWFVAGKKLCKNNEPIEKFSVMADIVACVIPLAHGIGRIGCLTAGCCHGAPTDAWYGITMWTGSETGWMKVIPTQLFEALFLFALSGVLFALFYSKIRKEGKCVPLLPIYVVAYAVWRFFIEYLRADDRGATIVSFLSPSQLIALLMVVVGVAYFLVWYLNKKGILPQWEIISKLFSSNATVEETAEKEVIVEENKQENEPSETEGKEVVVEENKTENQPSEAEEETL